MKTIWGFGKVQTQSTFGQQSRKDLEAGRQLVEYRRTWKLKQRDAGALLKLSPHAIRGIEKGTHRPVNGAEKRLADLLKGPPPTATVLAEPAEPAEPESPGLVLWMLSRIESLESIVEMGAGDRNTIVARLDALEANVARFTYLEPKLTRLLRELDIR